MINNTNNIIENENYQRKQTLLKENKKDNSFFLGANVKKTIHSLNRKDGITSLRDRFMLQTDLLL